LRGHATSTLNRVMANCNTGRQESFHQGSPRGFELVSARLETPGAGCAQNIRATSERLTYALPAKDGCFQTATASRYSTVARSATARAAAPGRSSRAPAYFALLEVSGHWKTHGCSLATKWGIHARQKTLPNWLSECAGTCLRPTRNVISSTIYLAASLPSFLCRYAITRRVTHTLGSVCGNEKGDTQEPG